VCGGGGGWRRAKREGGREEGVNHVEGEGGEDEGKEEDGVFKEDVAGYGKNEKLGEEENR
jgi:hypothetical protein